MIGPCKLDGAKYKLNGRPKSKRNTVCYFNLCFYLVGPQEKCLHVLFFRAQLGTGLQV